MDNLIGQSNYMAHHDDTGPSTNLKSSTKTLSDNVLYETLCPCWRHHLPPVVAKRSMSLVWAITIVSKSWWPKYQYWKWLRHHTAHLSSTCLWQSTRLHPPHSQTPQRDPQYMGIRGYINVLLNHYPSSPIVHVNSCFCVWYFKLKVKEKPSKKISIFLYSSQLLSNQKGFSLTHQQCMGYT